MYIQRGNNQKWLGHLGSNQGISESKSDALPLGYAPKMVGEGGFEPPNPKEQIYSLPRLTVSLFSQQSLVSNDDLKLKLTWWML